ncbi:MAG: UDP-N-acetylmuramate--L-alanine ligase [Patescibacteria group bacterium]
MPKKLSKKQNIYCIGVKGVGMTMLAQFLAAKGNKISGSDIVDVFLTDRVLRKAKIKVFSPFAVKNIPDKIDAIIYSTSQDLKNNPELAFIKNNPARFQGVSFLSYAEALGQVFNQYRGVAVCGSHGKTTTSAWLGYVLMKAGKKPNVLVGSRVPQFAGSGLSGSSSDFIAEVDEYQNKLQYFQPHGVVLNNIDYDHPDFFKTPAAYTKVFADFVKKIPARGFLVVSQRDLESQKIKRYCRGKLISYNLVTGSYGAGADYLAYDVKTSGIFQSFSLSYQGEALGRFKIKLWGEHNILNALATIAAAREMKVAWPQIRKHLAGFRGTDRRAQILGKYKGALIVDDYAHHPTEIKSTLAGLRRHYPTKNIITVFHPHTFTRTKAFFKDFAVSFADTNELIVLDIYGSAREKQGDVSSRELVVAIKKYNQSARIKQPVRAIANIPEAIQYLKNRLQARDSLVLMGAGDVFRIADGLLKPNQRK